ncbi:hypothetical protein ALQ67_200014 [Pseudomonas savastanoi pv. glycinea]|nr:hypothetical protein ALQ67_200014 [Pseudomonas savastanoi pv. glycinea]
MSLKQLHGCGQPHNPTPNHTKIVNHESPFYVWLSDNQNER